MRPFALAGVLVVSALGAEASPFDGRWAFEREICANKPGDSDLIPVEIKDRSIVAFASSCEIGEVTPLGKVTSVWRVNLLCSEEGEEGTFASQSVFVLENDSAGKPLALIEIELPHGAVRDYLACD